MNAKSCRNFALAALLTLSLGATSSVQAQTTPPSASEPETDGDVVELSPFVVDSSRDIGYTAVEALAGGRTNTPITLTPASMSSLTKTFIDDLGIQSVREALQWTPNVVPTDPLAGKGFGGQAFHAWSFNYRGAGAGQQGGPGPTRNYFSFYQDADSYNIERIEVTRGPNSILFGLGTVGGTLTTYTKVARLNETFLSPTIVVDNNGSFRLEADYNIALRDNLALRTNIVFDDNEGWRNADENKKRALDLAFRYKLSDKTSLRLELEGVRLEKTLISSTIGDKLSGWDGTTASQTWGAAPTNGTGTAARTIPVANAGAWGDWLNPFWVYIPSLGDKALMGWRGGYASSSSLVDVGAALPFAPHAGWYPDQIKLPWESAYSSTANIPIRPSDDWTYGHGISKINYEDITAFLDHTINDNFDLQLGAYRYTDDQEAKDYEGTGGAAIDINRQLPDGSANPNFGKAFADFFLSKQTQARAVTEGRAQLNYHFDSELFGQRWSQLFSLSAARKELTISARQYLGQIDTPLASPGDWVQNMIWGRLYLDEPNQEMNIPDQIGSRKISYLPKADGYWFDFDDEFDLTDYAIFSHTRLFDDDLSIMIGARYDSYDEHLLELRRGPNLTDRVVEESDNGQTYSAGAVYWLGKFGVYANYSENIQPPNAGSQPYLNGDRPAPEEGETFDYGFRFSTGDGKYYAQIGRYDSKSRGHNVENPVGIRGVWERYNLATGRPQQDGFGTVAYSDTTSLDVSGYELEITGNPWPNLRLQANYGLPDTAVVDFYPHTRAHFAEYLPTWNAAVNATTDPTLKSNLQNAISSAQNTLDQAQEGNPESQSVDYTASFFANYTFTESTFKGLSVGAGASFTGKRYLGTFDNVRHYGDSFSTVNAVLAYETRMFNDTKVRFALNVDNLLDENDPILTSYHWGFTSNDGSRVPDGYYLQTPRTVRLSARFTF